MAEYRKKPVVIEALVFTDDAERLIELQGFMNAELVIDYKRTDNPVLKIETSEGVMEAEKGDYIIKEPFATDDRKFYPCKPDIFQQTYELVNSHGS